MIYFDNAATTALSHEVLTAMTPYFDNIYANPSSSHSMGIKAHKAMDDCTAALRASLGTDNIIYTSGGSESDNQALMTAAAIGKTIGKTHIVSTLIEHPAIIKTLEKLSLDGITYTLVKPRQDGIVYAEDIADAITDKTVLVSVMFANNETGNLMPIKEIGALCRARGVYFHTDAVQAAGKTCINCNEMYIDMLSLSAHKFHGPRGVGLLCFSDRITPVTLINGGMQQSGLRAGTENLPSIVGMTEALLSALRNLDKTAERVSTMRQMLLQGLVGSVNVHINTCIPQSLPGTLNVSFDGYDASALLEVFDLKGLIASGGSACHSGCVTPSGVLTAMGLSDELALAAVRFSIDAYNTESEVIQAIEIIKDSITKIAHR